MIIGTVSVHDIQEDDPVTLRNLKGERWCLTIGDVDFFCTSIDVLRLVFDRVHELVHYTPIDEREK